MRKRSMKTELQTLIEQPQGTCVSLFLPTHRAGVETLQGRIRLKNLLREAEQHLLACNLRASVVKEVLEPVQALVEDALFWQEQGDGLAIFRSQDMLRSYRLPYPVEESVIVGRRFHLKPLLPFLLGDEQRFYLLALSQNNVRLFEGTRHRISEHALPEAVPRSLAEILAYKGAERQLQVYAGMSTGRGRQQVAVMHGQGEDSTDEQLLRYFQRIDRGLQPMLREERVPLVLAGVEHLLPIYHKANTYAQVLEQGVTGNPDRLGMETLHQQAWKVAAPHFLKEQEYAAARYRQYVSTRYVSSLAASDIEAIVPVAYTGRVGTLFVAVDRHEWGSFEPDTMAVSIRQQAECGDEDLLDFAAVQTLLYGGTVYAVEQRHVPGGTLAAALFRY